jgi:hypothetical protein
MNSESQKLAVRIAELRGELDEVLEEKNIFYERRPVHSVKIDEAGNMHGTGTIAEYIWTISYDDEPLLDDFDEPSNEELSFASEAEAEAALMRILEVLDGTIREQVRQILAELAPLERRYAELEQEEADA